VIPPTSSCCEGSILTLALWICLPGNPLHVKKCVKSCWPSEALGSNKDRETENGHAQVRHRRAKARNSSELPTSGQPSAGKADSDGYTFGHVSSHFRIEDLLLHPGAGVRPNSSPFSLRSTISATKHINTTHGRLGSTDLLPPATTPQPNTRTAVSPQTLAIDYRVLTGTRSPHLLASLADIPPPQWRSSTPWTLSCSRHS